MSLELLKQLRSSVVLTCLLAGALTITACQQQSETEGNAVDGIHTEETVPMSAEPADPNEVIIDTTDTTDIAMDEEKDDTTASTESNVN